MTAKSYSPAELYLGSIGFLEYPGTCGWRRYSKPFKDHSIWVKPGICKIGIEERTAHYCHNITDAIERIRENDNKI